jgi:catechol 2,3-dioxygenase-like lactoylglutathione lyase family enzyme
VPKLIRVVPSVPIRSLGPALAFYCDKLGFNLRHRFEGDGGAIVARDGVELHLTVLDDSTWKTRADFAAVPVKSGAESFLPGTAAYRIEVDDVRALHDEYRSSGALTDPERAVRERAWGESELALTDPDKNLLVFFQRRPRSAHVDERR